MAAAAAIQPASRLFKPGGRHTAAIRLLNLEASDDLLNVGCSHGYMEAHLEGQARRLVGVDMSDDAIGYAKRNVAGAEFYRCDAAALPFADGEFGKVLCEDVLEHVDDEDGTLREIARVLRPGGLVVLSTPNDFLNRLDPGFPDHRHYSAARLTEMLARHGIGVERVHRAGLLPHLVDAILRYGRPRRSMRRVTRLIENADQRFNLGFGFTVIVSGRKS